MTANFMLVISTKIDGSTWSCTTGDPAGLASLLVDSLLSVLLGV